MIKYHKKNFQYNFELRGAKVDPNVIPHFVVENEVTLKNDVITKLGDYDAVVISDYDKGFLTESSIKYLIAKYPMTFIDSKKLFNDWINDATFLKINEVEFNRNKKNL